METKTSIIILSFNTYEYTRACIESIRMYTKPGSYELIVIDNGSTDASVSWLCQQPDVQCVCNKENRGFPKGCNQGMALASGSDLLLLNSDVIVTSHWLEQLKIALYSSEKIGAVGCVTNQCSNAQHIPVFYRNMQEMWKVAARFNHSNPAKWERRLLLVGFCYLFKREVYEKIGALDERFSPGNFEDDDYSLRIWRAGYELLLCQDTFIHHFRGVSFFKEQSGEANTKKVKLYNELLVKNFNIFLEKWQIPKNYKLLSLHEVFSDWQGNDVISLAEKERLKLDEKKICFITYVTDSALYNKTVACLRELKVPHGMTMESLVVSEAESILDAYQAGMKSSNAKYKVYLQQGVCLQQKDFLERLLQIFQIHREYGIAGILGTRHLFQGDWWLQKGFLGKIDFDSSTNRYQCVYPTGMPEYTEAAGLGGVLLATQYDIDWRIELPLHREFFAVAHCQEFWRRGFRSIVLQTQATFLERELSLTDEHATIEEGKVFLQEYAGELWRE